ncbi:MAG TPA: oligopeptide/dipeptide ABC transporter ATP-binding protein [Ilumatobacter sp.]|nr:oligopeptide/dipeptide ABC transporter ATP-binding protein [Ilumatobacter sp.]
MSSGVPITAQPVLEVRDLEVEFRLRGRPLRRGRQMLAVNRVNFTLERGKVLGLVGESGSGKSSAARGAMRLVDGVRGSVRLDGVELVGLSRRDLRHRRRDMQMVFQDPYSSLDPSSQIRDSVGEPLIVHEQLRGGALTDRVAELLGLVGLSTQYLTRYPGELSGGQRQRIAIARAIALNPKVVFCDEAVSALDVSTQNQVIRLLKGLQESLGLAYVFITHDLSVVRHISDRVAVMYLGQIVESGPTGRIFESPAHPYTRALLSAALVPDPAYQRARTRIVLQGDLPDPANPPAGCSFAGRCGDVMERCRVEAPQPTPVAGGGEVACHLYPVAVPVPDPASAPQRVIEAARPQAVGLERNP